jgi:hypothetical protein
MILLVGAEFTRVWAERKGTRFLPVQGAIHQEGQHDHEGEDIQSDAATGRRGETAKMQV